MEHDYRNQSWGHALHVQVQPDGTYKGSVHCNRRMQVGDTVVWETNYGEAVAEVVYCQCYFDPPDMYKVEFRVIERRVRKEVLENETPPWEYTVI